MLEWSIPQVFFGEVSEWLMVTHSKCVLGKPNGGSNPPLSVAIMIAAFLPFAADFPALDWGLFLLWELPQKKNFLVEIPGVE